MTSLQHVLQAADEQLALNAFFHASSKQLPVGRTIVSRGSGGLTPKIVNAARPKGVPPRNRQLFMVKNRDCLDDSMLGQDERDQYVYRVTPTRRVQHANWSQLERVLECAGEMPRGRCSKTKVQKAAKAYWHGKPVGKARCADEYLTMAFHVDELVHRPRKTRTKTRKKSSR